MKTNQISINLLGDPIAGLNAAQVGLFLDTVGNLWVQSVLRIVQRSLDDIIFHFVCPYNLTLPANVAAVVSYFQTLADSGATEILTTIQKPYVTEGDLIVALSAAGLEPELNDYLTIDLSVVSGVADLKLWIGYAAGSAQDGVYTPFAGADAYRAFSAPQAMKTRKDISKLPAMQPPPLAPAVN